MTLGLRPLDITPTLRDIDTNNLKKELLFP